MNSRTTVILVILALIVAGAIAYFVFVREDAAPAISSETTTASEAELVFINLTAELESISFDTAVLDDPRFMALEDIRTAILPEATGRRDPFAPLGR